MDNETDKKTNSYTKRPVWQWVAMYGVAGLLVYGFIYYLITNKSGYASANATGQPTQTSISMTNVQQFTVTGTEFSFDPAVITVKKGVPVQIIFKNAGKYSHNLMISDLNAQTKVIKPGEQDLLTFTPTTAGQYTFICSVPGHADRGMTGTLTVN